MDNSSACKSFSNCSANSDDSPDQESSWTFYFQDFLCNNNNEETSLCSGFESASLVSDAASLAPYHKLAIVNRNGALDINDHTKKKLGSKKRKIKGAAVDNDLEDTASSPNNSPKVSYMDQLCISSQKGKSAASILEGKVNMSGQMTSGLNVSRKEDERTELKKKGLCLVPVSMFTKYMD